MPMIAENINVVEVDTGEILTDTGRNGKERPWKSHKEEGLRLDNLFVTAKRLDNSIITDNGLKSLEECGDTLIFLRNENGEKGFMVPIFAEIDFALCATGGGRSKCIRRFPR